MTRFNVDVKAVYFCHDKLRDVVYYTEDLTIHPSISSGDSLAFIWANQGKIPIPVDPFTAMNLGWFPSQDDVLSIIDNTGNLSAAYKLVSK